MVKSNAQEKKFITYANHLENYGKIQCSEFYAPNLKIFEGNPIDAKACYMSESFFEDNCTDYGLVHFCTGQINILYEDL